MLQETFVIAPIQTLIDPEQLIGATVQAMPMDDPLYRHELYVGVIDDVKLHRWGTRFHFKTPDLVGGKWLRLERVIGFVLADESKKIAS